MLFILYKEGATWLFSIFFFYTMTNLILTAGLISLYWSF
ncbi:hypothetical protein B4168_2550 [Anoxybacillus flavithermus]|nr:hypothetical protein B4168_2550 [Anoxybacillus flavithermus]OAO85230.1 hypothetical protein GT23_2921 [Parageobacillus thermoglucosidasius]